VPKVSIVTPCYNAEEFLTATIDSVRAQDFADWEQVIVDDGSTDRSAEIAALFAARDPRVRLVRQTNRGVNAARNAGFAACSPDSEMLLFLDADDLLKPAMLSTLLAYLDEHPSADMAFCRFERIDGRGIALPAERRGSVPYALENGRLVRLTADRRRVPFDTVFWWLDMAVMSALMRRSAYERLPGWDEAFGQGCEDTDLLLRFFLAGEVHAIDETLVSYRVHAGQATARSWRMKRRRGALHDKWLSGVGLAEEDRRAFRLQWALYERRVMPCFLLGEAAELLRAGKPGRAARLCARAVAHFLIYCTAPVRRLVWPYLWYLA